MSAIDRSWEGGGARKRGEVEEFNERVALRSIRRRVIPGTPSWALLNRQARVDEVGLSNVNGNEPIANECLRRLQTGNLWLFFGQLDFILFPTSDTLGPLLMRVPKSGEYHEKVRRVDG